MATSNIQTFTTTGALVIKEALQLIGRLAEGEDPSATETTDCLRSLNYMIKHWQGKHGGNLWTAERLVFVPTFSQYQYPIDYTRRISTLTSFNVTHVSSAAAIGASTIAVDLAAFAPIDSSTEIGVETTSGRIEWFTASSGSTTTSFVIDGTLAAAAAVGGVVYFYTPFSSSWEPPKYISSVNWVPKPVAGSNGISTTTLYDNVFSGEIPIRQLARNDYNSLTSKSLQGRPVNMHWEKLENTVFMYLWPAPAKETDLIFLWAHKQLDVMNADSNDVEYPQEWFLALAWNLAIILAPKYGKMLDSDFKALALQFLNDAESSDTEGYIKFEPDQEGMMYE